MNAEIPRPPRTQAKEARQALVIDLPPVSRETPAADGGFDHPPSGFPEVTSIVFELPVGRGTDDGPLDPKFD